MSLFSRRKANRPSVPARSPRQVAPVVRAATAAAVESLEGRRLLSATVTELASWVNPDAITGYDGFGEAVDARGNWVLVGQSAFGAEGYGRAVLFDASNPAAAPIIFDNPEPDGFDGFGSAVAILGNGKFAIASREDDFSGRVYLYDGPTDTTPEVLQRETPVALSGYGQSLAAWGTDGLLFSVPSGDFGSGEVVVYDTAQNAAIASYAVGETFDLVTNYTIAVKGDRALIGSKDASTGYGEVLAVDLAGGTTDTYAFGSDTVENFGFTLAFAANGDALVGSFNTVYQIDPTVAGGKILQTFDVPPAGLAFYSIAVPSATVAGGEFMVMGVANDGAAYVFDTHVADRNVTTPPTVAPLAETITPSVLHGAGFGTKVASFGDGRIVITSQNDDASLGAAYLFCVTGDVVVEDPKVVIAATGGNDTVTLSAHPSIAGGVLVTVTDASGATTTTSYDPADGFLEIRGGDGADVITIGGDVPTSLDIRVFGEGGNDSIKGGKGGDVLFGGDGDDLIVGGSSNDLMVGGAGADRLIGQQADDVLVAGAAPEGLIDLWLSGDDAGLHALLAGVASDGAHDLLTGNTGIDWFIFSDEDKVTDLRAEDFTLDELTFVTTE